MPRVPRVDVPGALYDVIDRGNDRQTIFRTDQDRRDFLHRLSKLALERAFRLFAYCLLDNHFHLLLESTERRLGHAMGRLLTGYVVTYNRLHNRVGHLFQDRFKAPLCDSEAYLLELIRYIHLNPVRAGIVALPEQYRWSSHRAYLGQARFEGLEIEPVLALLHAEPFRARQLFGEFVAEGITNTHRRADLTGRLREAVLQADGQEFPLHNSGTILGSRGFAEETLIKADAQNTLAQWYQLRAVGVDEVAQIVTQSTGISCACLRQRGRRHQVAEARSLFCVLLIDEVGLRPREARKYLGVTDGAVSHALNRGRKQATSTLYDRARLALRSLIRD
jgi:REP element-mobilizing transposase RayT